MAGAWRRARDGWRRVPRPMRRGLLILLVVGVVGYFVAVQWSEARLAAEAAVEVNLWLLLLATGLQVLGLACQALLTRSVLPRDDRPTVPAILRIEMATLAVSHTVPGGTAAGSALAYRLLRRAGPAGADVGFALGVRGIGSAIVLNAILWLTLVVSIPLHGFDPRYTAAALAAVILFGFAGALVPLLTRRPEPTARFIGRTAGRLRRVDGEKVAASVGRVADRTTELVERPEAMLRVAGWSAAYWLLSAASLWVFLASFGFQARVDELLVAFGLVNVLAVIPVTPRGLGVVEGVLIPTLVGFGAGTGQAIRGVLAWRLVSFWAPIPVGGLTYLSLRAVPPATTGRDGGREAREALDEVIDVVEREARSLRSWARDVGPGDRSG